MIIYQAKFFQLSGSLHNRIIKMNFGYAFSLNKMKAVTIPKSSQNINARLLHVTYYSDSLILSN